MQKNRESITPSFGKIQKQFIYSQLTDDQSNVAKFGQGTWVGEQAARGGEFSLILKPNSQKDLSSTPTKHVFATSDNSYKQTWAWSRGGGAGVETPKIKGPPRRQKCN